LSGRHTDRFDRFYCFTESSALTLINVFPFDDRIGEVD
jgi:hypothetical protein